MSAPARSLPKRAIGTALLLGAVWLILFDALRLDWETNAQYSYGWLVPILAAYLFWQRWPSRPPVALPRGKLLIGVITVALAVAFFPTRLVGEAVPEWSVVRWALALEVVGLTLVSVVRMAGWRAMRHFAFPIAFVLIAVAWPVRWETALTQNLMQHLAAFTAEIMNWAGVSAVAQGNLIRLSTGVVGVDEACSGVRSLQSMLMASLFLGELNRLPALTRVVLVIAGLALAVVFNVLRALTLLTVAVQKGLGALAGWHDPAGFSILALSFGGLCLLVWFMRPRPAGQALETASVRAGSWCPLPASWLLALGLWLVVAEGATEWWYRSHESGRPAAAGWTVRWPEAAPRFRDVPIDPQVRATLAYNEGREAAWQGDDGSQWLMFFFKWYPSRASTIAARLHRPEVCLPATGCVLVGERPPIIVKAGDLEIPFHFYEFEASGRPVHVFFCLWEAANQDKALPEETQSYSRANRLKRVWLGQRNLGQQSVEIVITGMDTPEAARAAFEERITEIVVPSA